ncbi:YihY/virulence factor BrkB family protein [Porphyrobacter sp. CACIAM 03H1]|uniref:YihY/virulence factor BrkB family protein n=1 Tax=Porphyrobacter sp. CACIAM 03H1 TaxID=2003315 RepID=UPI000B5A7EE2|nr:YihY/virulence factor BrkB family protein [Porphyrobacter sp. CACIAM 03H1]ASJ89761.1 ribonuclease BN [Porphyrobacter sp. CACIAM 03H1]
MGDTPPPSNLRPRFWAVVGQVATDTFNDGFIHAGNLAYLGMLAIFPFFILGAALFDLIGGRDNAETIILSVAQAMPQSVADTIVPVAEDVIYARSGWLLWAGGAVGLWTVSSLIETIRDILRRAYGVRSVQAFWRTRLLSAGLILAAVVVLMLSLFAQVMIGGAQEVIAAAFPQLGEWIGTLRLSRIVPALGLAASLWVLFVTLTPPAFRGRRCPKWPGALFTALWWLAVAAALPIVLRSVFTYDLTYGSLAGSMVTLLFFWLVGLGLVIGAELNAALAPEGLDRRAGEASEEKA